MALTKITSDIVESNIQQSGFKNKIIGGDFSTNPWQRGTTFATVADNTYTADRWVYKRVTDTGVVSILKTLDAPLASQAGIFTQHCLDVDVTTADASIGIGEYSYIEQRIEGINSMSFGFGQAGTRFVSLSFWHKHTKTGSYSVSLSNSALSRSYVADYVQAVSNVWQKSTLTIPVDTAGTWLYDTGIGLRVRFCIASGSTFQSAPSVWSAGDFLSSPSQVNGLDSATNNFKIALVQLEIGSNDSMFESRAIGQELQLCQRYYEQVGAKYYAGCLTGYSPNSYSQDVKYITQKRSTPSMIFKDTVGTTGTVSLFKAATAYNGVSITNPTIGIESFQAFTTSGVSDASMFGFSYIASAEL